MLALRSSTISSDHQVGCCSVPLVRGTATSHTRHIIFLSIRRASSFTERGSTGVEKEAKATYKGKRSVSREQKRHLCIEISHGSVKNKKKRTSHSFVSRRAAYSEVLPFVTNFIPEHVDNGHNTRCPSTYRNRNGNNFAVFHFLLSERGKKEKLRLDYQL